MNTLMDNIIEIKRQKDTYIKPGNLKKDVEVFGVTGNLDIPDFEEIPYTSSFVFNPNYRHIAPRNGTISYPQKCYLPSMKKYTFSDSGMNNLEYIENGYEYRYIFSEVSEEDRIKYYGPYHEEGDWYGNGGEGEIRWKFLVGKFPWDWSEIFTRYPYYAVICRNSILGVYFSTEEWKLTITGSGDYVDVGFDSTSEKDIGSISFWNQDLLDEDTIYEDDFFTNSRLEMFNISLSGGASGFGWSEDQTVCLWGNVEIDDQTGLNLFDE